MSNSFRTTDELTLDHRIFFNATVDQQLTAGVCGMVDGTKTCRLPVGAAEVTLPISRLDWAATGKPMDRGPILPWI